ncbi:MAG: hypothetical protein F6K19_37890 [Cyanothece sp. SIO1E1]|nr:hypothetical protein [Cyanothece sp. SIO1E1]
MESIAATTITWPIREHFDPKNCGQVSLALHVGSLSRVELTVRAGLWAKKNGESVVTETFYQEPIFALSQSLSQ